MVKEGRVHAVIPVTSLERAKQWYSERLGLEPLEGTSQSLFYECGNDSHFVLYPSTGHASGDHTQLGWHVADIEAEVAGLEARGVVFEEYDLPGLKTVNSIAPLAHGRCAWFKDSEGNMLSVTQLSAEIARGHRWQPGVSKGGSLDERRDQ